MCGPWVAAPLNSYWLWGVITIKFESVFSSPLYSSSIDRKPTSSMLIVLGIDQLSLAVIT